MCKHIEKKSDCYLAYWRKKRAEKEKLNSRLESEAKSELHKIISVLAEKYKVRRIILFGSLKTGEFTETSDIDIAVEGIKDEDFFSALAAVNRVSRFSVDLKPLEDLEPNFRLQVCMKGELVYEKDNPN